MEQGSDIPPEGSAERGRGPVGSLFNSIAQMLATALGIAQTRLELLTTELREEVHRVAEIMVYTAVALLAAGVGLFMLALVVVFIFWDTHRLAASIAVTRNVWRPIAVWIGVAEHSTRSCSSAHS